MADTMTNKFLQGTAVPYVLETAQAMVQLWTEKLRLADGRPFEGMQAIHAAVYVKY